MPYEIIRPGKQYDDLTLQMFGRLLALAPVQADAGKNITWLCVCHCGNVVTRKSNCLKRVRRHSCGCLGKNTHHGSTGTREYVIWQGMKSTCLNPAAPNFRWYGGRGISVCESWLSSFEDFYRDMGACPQSGTLDRIDNNGSYSPENCRWANHKTQFSNKRNNRLITYNGDTHTVAEWARKLGIIPDTISYRISKGWPIEKAFQAPMNTGRHPTSHNKTPHIDNC